MLMCASPPVSSCDGLVPSRSVGFWIQPWILFRRSAVKVSPNSDPKTDSATLEPVHRLDAVEMNRPADKQSVRLLTTFFSLDKAFDDTRLRVVIPASSISSSSLEL